MELTDRVAVITGGGGGIGAATARALAQEGASVIVADREGHLAEEVAVQVTDGGGRALGLETDVSDEAAVDRMVEAALSRFARVDILVANAAVAGWGTLLETTPEYWDEQMAVNLRGVFLCARRTLPEMIRQKRGVVLITSSDCAIRTCPGLAAYNIAKAGLIAMARSIAVDHGRDGIRANAVVPGLTDTPGFQKWNSEGSRTPESQRAKGEALSPLGRIGQAEDLAEAMVFLASDRASFVTGSTMVVDGGMTITYGVD